MSQKWNLQDIKPAQPRKRRPPSQSSMGVEPEQLVPDKQENIQNIFIKDGTQKGSHKIILAIVLFVVIVGAALGLSAILGKTELTIYPEFREPTISSEFIAYSEPREDSLSYEILTLESTSESQVKASGQVEVQEQATGVIEISKTTPGTERLIKNTRFRTSNGLIFRTQESVVVPGAVTDGSGTTIPGTVEAQVFADEIGEQYNLAAGTKFDIPGFEEGGYTDLFNAIYAQNKQAFSGGFDGPQFQIDESELNTARQALQAKLRDELLSRIENEKPTGFVTFPGAIAVVYTQLPAVEFGNDLVTIKEQAILQIPLFKAEEFGSYLAKQAVATYSGGPVRVDDPTQLDFKYTVSTTSNSSIANEPSIAFTLTGRPLLIWEYDADKLRTDLAGLPKTAINNAITAHPGIEGAKVRITPFWKRTFPEAAEDIVIIEELRKVE